jgi:hypothetical protein
MGRGAVDFGRAMYANDALPSWAAFDSRHREQYPWGMAPPGRTPEDWVKSGYRKKAATAEQLALRVFTEAADHRSHGRA